MQLTSAAPHPVLRDNVPKDNIERLFTIAIISLATTHSSRAVLIHINAFETIYLRLATVSCLAQPMRANTSRKKNSDRETLLCQWLPEELTNYQIHPLTEYTNRRLLRELD
jgi:hypothetical protein